MFTHEYLQALATATVFSRGKDYFRSKNVGRITREGDKFTAKVRGSYPYQVQLTLRPGGAKLRCTCPYDVDGICKHAVALGLAVLAEFGPRLAARVPAAQPAAFTIDSISTEVYEALSDLAFDDELLEGYADNYEEYLYDEGDGMWELASEAIDEVLLPHAEAVAEALHAGHLTEALRRWVGVYEGSAAATAPEADDYDLFGYEGYPAHVQARWWELLAGQQTPQLLENKVFGASEMEAALALLTERYREPAPVPKTPARGQTAPTSPAPPLAIPPHFYDLLHALAHDPATAARLRPLLAEVPTPDVG
ncbi:MAG: hypothetical protein EOO59_19235, partial [Hymenobacter sp.]